MSDIDPRVAHIEYRCTGCGGMFDREELSAKKVTWLRIDGQHLKSRTRGWFCDPCRDEQDDWTATKHASSPGLAGAGQGRAARKKARDATG